MIMNIDTEYYTTTEIATKLNVSVPTIRKWVLNDKIPYKKFGKLVRFKIEEIKAWEHMASVNPPDFYDCTGDDDLDRKIRSTLFYLCSDIAMHFEGREIEWNSPIDLNGEDPLLADVRIVFQKYPEEVFTK